MSEQFPAHLAAAIKDRIAVLRQAWDDDEHRAAPGRGCRGTRRPRPPPRREPGAFPMSQTLSLPVTAAGRQQHDLYDLPLSTTPSAAEQFRDAQARLLRVQTGVAAPLQRAVALDPRVRPRPRRRSRWSGTTSTWRSTRWRTCAPPCGSAVRATARERSFVGAVSARIRGAADHQARLLQHLAEHPRDALALNMAVPTIAFSGAVEVPEQAWALVEAARPVFGSDWWYAGLLAFVRQEQGHFDEADDLAQRRAGRRARGRARRTRDWPTSSTRPAGTATGCAGSTAGSATTGPPRSSPSHYSWHAAG